MLMQVNNLATPMTSCFGEKKLKANSTCIWQKNRTMTQIGDSPKWLPSRWITEIRTLHSGRQDKYYIYLSSGKKCRSKVEVMRYIESIDIKKNVGQATNFTSCSEENEKKMVKQENNQAAPSTSCFGENKLKASSTYVRRKQRTSTKVGVSPDWLPSGWIMEIKTRHNGLQYKCYSDPFTGSRFYSKKAVFRFLECVQLYTYLSNGQRSMETSFREGCTSSDQRGSINNKSTENVLSQIEYSPDCSPDGWIKEIEVRNDNKKRVKKNQTPIAAKKQIPRGSGVKRCFFARLAPCSNATATIEIDELSEKPEFPCQHPLPAQGKGGARSSCLIPNIKHLAFHGNASYEGPVSVMPLNRTKPDEWKMELYMVNEEDLQLSQPGNDELFVQGDGLPEKRELELMNEELSQTAHAKLRRGLKRKRKYRKKHGTTDQGCSFKQEGMSQLRPRRAKGLKAITLPVRSSKRLAGIKADLGIGDLPCRAMTKKSKKFRASPTNGINPSEESHLTSVVLDEENIAATVEMESFKEGGSCQTSGIYDEKAAAAVGIQSLEKLENEHHPVEEAAHAYKQVGEGKPGDDNPRSPLVLPFGDSWSDPCFEFAIKTLRGDIPLFGDNAAIEEYFLQQLVSVLNPGPSSSSPLTSGKEKLQPS